MANVSFRIIVYLTDSDGNAITSGVHSPIAFRDSDQRQSWIEGTHLYNGLWYFDLPSGYPAFEVGVETSAGNYERDGYLSGPALTAAQLGIMLAPIQPVES